jgi:hypothetical protein
MVDIVFLSFAILGYAIMGVIIVIMFWLDRDGLLNSIKVRFGKGQVYTLMFGSDRRLYLGAKQFSRKSQDTATTDIDGMPYTMNSKKLWFYNRQPALIFNEGVSEPIDISSGQVQSSGLTSELFKQAIIVARQSGRMPQTENMAKWQFYLTIGACAGSVICAYMVYKLTGNFDTFTKNLTPILQGIADSIAKLVS